MAIDDYVKNSCINAYLAGILLIGSFYNIFLSKSSPKL